MKNKSQEMVQATMTGGHPDAEQLVAYHAGELHSAAHESLGAHLDLCEECARIVRDLTDPEEDPELDAAWRSMEERRMREGKVSVGDLALAPRSAFPWPRAMAAALVCFMLGSVVGFFGQGAGPEPERLRQAEARIATLEHRLEELDKPQALGVGEELIPRSFLRVARTDAVFKIPAEAAFFSLTLFLPSPEPEAAYNLDISDATGQVVWRGEGLPTTELGHLFLLLPRGFLPVGDYRLRLYAGTEDADEVIAEYGLRLESEKGL